MAKYDEPIANKGEKLKAIPLKSESKDSTQHISFNIIFKTLGRAMLKEENEIKGIQKNQIRSHIIHISQMIRYFT